jgi:hypothetical protein
MGKDEERMMVDRGWIVVNTGSEIHVLPYEGKFLARDHEPILVCPACRPVPVRDGWLDEPAWSHTEPTWPGATQGYLN